MAYTVEKQRYGVPLEAEQDFDSLDEANRYAEMLTAMLTDQERRSGNAYVVVETTGDPE